MSRQRRTNAAVCRVGRSQQQACAVRAFAHRQRSQACAGAASGRAVCLLPRTNGAAAIPQLEPAAHMVGSRALRLAGPSRVSLQAPGSKPCTALEGTAPFSNSLISRKIGWETTPVRQPRRCASSTQFRFGAPVAQLDRAPGYEEVKGWFDSCGFGRRIRSLEEGTFPHGMRSDQSVTKAGPRFLSARL
jgi:hypothetical protein